MAVVNEAVAGHTVNLMELNTLDVSFVPQGMQNAALLCLMCTWCSQLHYRAASLCRGDQQSCFPCMRLAHDQENDLLAGRHVECADARGWGTGGLHYYVNDYCDPGTLLATFNNADPGTVVATDVSARPCTLSCSMPCGQGVVVLQPASAEDTCDSSRAA